MFGAKQRKPQKHGHLSVPASRGRALSVSATTNQTRVFPRPIVTSNNVETRDLGLKTRGGRAPEAHACAPTYLQPAVARLSVSLAARGQGAKCTLSMVTDSAGARPRKMVTAVMANFDRFLRFSASLKCKRKDPSFQLPKTAEIDQWSEGQSVSGK